MTPSQDHPQRAKTVDKSEFEKIIKYPLKNKRNGKAGKGFIRHRNEIKNLKKAEKWNLKVEKFGCY